MQIFQWNHKTQTSQLVITIPIIIWVWWFCLNTDLDWFLIFSEYNNKIQLIVMILSKCRSFSEYVLRQNNQTQMIISMVIINQKICVLKKIITISWLLLLTVKRSKITEDLCVEAKSSNSDNNEAIQDVAKRLPMLDETIQNEATRLPMLDKAILMRPWGCQCWKSSSRT